MNLRTGLLLVVVAVGCVTAEADDAVKLTVYRQFSSNQCTSGYLAVEDTILAYTVELPFINNIGCISSIPAGIYHAHLKYENSNRWRIELNDVPDRANIQFHMGNWPSDTRGCILVGDKLSPDLCSIKGGASTLGFEKLKQAFYASAAEKPYPVKDILVEFTGPARVVPIPGGTAVDPCPQVR